MSEIIFSYAENAFGRMVHIDDVPQGLKCNCICPYCKEKLIARHGKIRSHCFAHHSDDRGANLKICYKVIVYKLAEQIIQTNKKVHLPSYYGIFKESDIEFAEVRIDSNFEREDKQPDVIATTIDGRQILIEFTFQYKARRKNAADYNNLICLEIDLSDTSLDELEDFLLNSNRNRRWINNPILFNAIEPAYFKANKKIKLKNRSECERCTIKDKCRAVRPQNSDTILEIENNGQQFRICKIDEYENTILIQRELIAKHQRLRHQRLLQQQLRQQRLLQQREEAIAREQEAARQRRIEENKIQAAITTSIDCKDRTCFMCRRNLEWKCNDRTIAHCGSYLSMCVPINTPPETARHCSGFKAKVKSK